MIKYIGITENSDPTCDFTWKKWIIEQKKPAILITKRPRLFLEQNKELLASKPNIIIHCTITGLGGTPIEPNIDKPLDSLDAYEEMSHKLGFERVVLRIDPIIENYPDKDYLDFLHYLISHAKGRTRISFLDLYPHVEERFRKAGIEIEQKTFNLPLKTRELIWELLDRPEVCWEPNMTSHPCVSTIDCNILKVSPSEEEKKQRYYCHCLANKKEINSFGSCTYGCLYCYWI